MGLNGLTWFCLTAKWTGLFNEVLPVPQRGRELELLLEMDSNKKKEEVLQFDNLNGNFLASIQCLIPQQMCVVTPQISFV